jgi:hypothetical protein
MCSLFDEFLCKFGWPTCAKKAQLSHERVEYNVFLFDEPLKGSKSLKILKISLTFRDKWWHLSKSIHIGENSQILTVSNKKHFSKNVSFSQADDVYVKIYETAQLTMFCLKQKTISTLQMYCVAFSVPSGSLFSWNTLYIANFRITALG